MQRDGGYLQALDRIGFPVEVSSSRTRHGETPADRLWNGLQPRARVPLDHPPPGTLPVGHPLPVWDSGAVAVSPPSVLENWHVLAESMTGG